MQHTRMTTPLSFSHSGSVHRQTTEARRPAGSSHAVVVNQWKMTGSGRNMHDVSLRASLSKLFFISDTSASNHHQTHSNESCSL